MWNGVRNGMVRWESLDECQKEITSGIEWCQKWGGKMRISG